jgi:cyanophycin synthetase
MLKLESRKPYLWRNVHAPEPVMAGAVTFGDAWNWTTERLPRALLSLIDAKLPAPIPSGDILDAAQLVAELAQRIQLRADIASPAYGVASRDPRERRAVVYFSCRDFTLANHSMSLAVQVVDWLAQFGKMPDRLAAMLQGCIDKVNEVGLQHSTLDMVQAATRMGIPWVRLSPLLRHVQLGHGHRQQRLWTTNFSTESALALDYSTNKVLTLETLSQIKLPVGRYAVVRDLATARKWAREIGYPVVLKPVDGKKGESVFVDLRTEAELTAAAAAAQIHERPYMLQSFFTGSDHRLLVVSGKLVAAARKDPASVTGDGHHTIAELVEIENRDPRRMSGRVMERIALDERSDGTLARQGFTRGSVAEAGRVVRVNSIANVSAGATAADVLGVIHPDNARAAIRAAKAIGLKICGVDFVSPDISKSWHEVGGGICEVNASVGLRPHFQTASKVDVCDLLRQAMFPQDGDGRIPTVIVTGSVGMTTTSKMLASILGSAGHIVGSATAEGVIIDGELIEQDDLADAVGASIVLRDPTVTAAVLETARVSIVKTGLSVDRCDVAALLDVEHDQIGADGIETLDDIVAVTRKVLDVARNAVVLNADDPLCVALAEEFRPRVRTILFSKSPETAAVRSHIAAGNEALFLAERDGRETIVVASRSGEVSLLATGEVPTTKDGRIGSSSLNALSASALAIGLNVGHDAIRSGLRRFGKEQEAAMPSTVFAAASYAVENSHPVFLERSETGKGEVFRAQA